MKSATEVICHCAFCLNHQMSNFSVQGHQGNTSPVPRTQHAFCEGSRGQGCQAGPSAALTARRELHPPTAGSPKSWAPWSLRLPSESEHSVIPTCNIGREEQTKRGPEHAPRRCLSRMSVSAAAGPAPPRADP